MGDLTLRLRSGRFNLRVGAVILHEGRLLAMQDENAPSFSLICAGNGPQSPRGIFVSGSGPSVPCSGMVQ